MRLLHTSDWHIGRTFHGSSLLADQAVALQSIADLCGAHQVEVVVISGDLYDRAIPSPEAVQTLTAGLRAIRDAGAEIVATAGNHDSGPRLGAFTDFLAAGGLHLRTSAADVGVPVLLADTHGPVAMYALPYLEPEISRRWLDLPVRADHQAVMTVALQLVRADLARRPAGTRSVVSAHAFVVGGVSGGSERSIAVGGVESVTADLFSGFDYVALGHLHRPQVLADRLRYSGSILPYSFTESPQPKSVWLVDLGLDGSIHVQGLALPVVRQLAVVRGVLSEILLSDSVPRDAYLAVELTDPVRPLDPMRRLHERFPHALTVSWVPDERPLLVDAAGAGRAEVSDEALLAGFVADVRGCPVSRNEATFLAAALTETRRAEAVG